jgi:hypothetical protein
MVGAVAKTACRPALQVHPKAAVLVRANVKLATAGSSGNGHRQKAVANIVSNVKHEYATERYQLTYAVHLHGRHQVAQVEEASIIEAGDSASHEGKYAEVPGAVCIALIHQMPKQLHQLLFCEGVSYGVGLGVHTRLTVALRFPAFEQGRQLCPVQLIPLQVGHRRLGTSEVALAVVQGLQCRVDLLEGADALRQHHHIQQQQRVAEVLGAPDKAFALSSRQGASAVYH